MARLADERRANTSIEQLAARKQRETNLFDAINFEGLAQFALYLGLSLVMLAVFVRLYVWTTPYHDIAEIAKGKMEIGRAHV